MRGTPEERFWAKVDKSGECWNWTAAKDRLGYGVFSPDRKNKQAHRVSYELANGPIAPGHVIDHTCHNKSCVNPQHLRAGTQKQNAENRRGASSNSASGIRGVHWHKRERRWRAIVVHNGKHVYVGLFKAKAEAEAAVIAKRNELYSFNDADRMGVAA